MQQSFFNDTSTASQLIEPDEARLVGPNNISIKTFGKTVIPVMLQQEVFNTEVIIADISQLLILGNDFLRKHKMVLDFDKQNLSTTSGTTLEVMSVEATCQDKHFPALTAKTCVINPGQQQALPITLPSDFPKNEEVMFIPFEQFDFSCSVLPHICTPKPNHKIINIIVSNIHHEPIMFEQFQEIGYLTEGPVSSEIKYLCEGPKSKQINEIKPLNISPEEDGQRWKTLLKALKEDLWELKPSLKQEALDILYKYRFLFALKNEPWGLCDQVHHTIEVTTDTPIKQKPRPVPPARRIELETIVNDLLQRGLIEETSSPWASPIVLVKKADSTLRMTVDLRRLNDVTVADAYPLPNTQHLLTTIQASPIYSTMDLCSGYLQIKMDPKDKLKTAFVVPNGLFCWRVMPFGAKNAGATFQRTINKIFSPISSLDLACYIDDLLCQGSTEEKHLEILTAVLDILWTQNLKIKSSKSDLFRKKLVFLGHVISSEGLQCEDAKVEAIRNYPTPTTVKEVRQALGLFSFY